MATEAAKARTFYGDQTIEVTIEKGPSSTGLYVVTGRNGDVRFSRHRDRLTPVNDAARAMLEIPNPVSA